MVEESNVENPSNVSRNIVVRTFEKSPKISIITGLIVVLTVGVLGTYLLHNSRAASCTVSAKLVNSCRPWLGGYGKFYPQAPDGLTNQISYHEQRIGRQVDVVRGNYHNGGQVLTSEEKAYANRANTMLLITWKPTSGAGAWKQASGGNATANANIDAMADSIKSLGSKKIFLSIWHEPQNDVTGGASGCISYSASANGGTPADYRAMWANVEKRFAAKGVTNVVWSLIYQGYPQYNCMMDDLWPGNSLVDWVDFDRYGNNQHTTWQDSTGEVYDYLTKTSDSTHDYLSKPWGVTEFSISGVNQATAYKYWDSLKAALDANTYPRLKMYLVFDSAAGAGGQVTASGDNRIEYDANGNLDPTEQAHYKAFAQDPRFTDAFYGTTTVSKDTVAPSISMSAPTNNQIIGGTFLVKTGALTDNVAVKGVTLRVDNKFVATLSSPYSYSLNTRAYADGKHTITLRAWDAASNYTDVNATVTINNSDKTPPSVQLNSPLNGQTVKGSLAVQATASDNVTVATVDFYLDGSLVSSQTSSPFCMNGASAGVCKTWDTTKVSDGSHAILVKAYDATGNTSSYGVTVYVANKASTDKTPAVITLNSPASGQTLSGKVTVTASATDNIAVTYLEIRVDDIIQATGTTDQLSFRLNSSPLKAGSHTITVIAKDAAGNTSTKSVTVKK